MDINISGNPGTGNTFQEIHIGTVQNFNPNATTVINNNYGEKPKNVQSADTVLQEAERENRKAAIMEYVLRLKDHISKEWKNRYETLWRNILSQPEVEEEIYEPGRQKFTTFNRNLVANILYVMTDAHIISTDNAATLALTLEGDKDHSVRAQLRQYPASQEISRKVSELIDNYE